MTITYKAQESNFFRYTHDLPVEHRPIEFFSDDEIEQHYAEMYVDEEPVELEFNHG